MLTPLPRALGRCNSTPSAETPCSLDMGKKTGKSSHEDGFIASHMPAPGPDCPESFHSVIGRKHCVHFIGEDTEAQGVRWPAQPPGACERAPQPSPHAVLSLPQGPVTAAGGQKEPWMGSREPHVQPQVTFLQPQRLHLQNDGEGV